MDYIVKQSIISQRVLNEETGELENKTYAEQSKRKTIKGGFNMIYRKNYEEIITEVVAGKKDLELFFWITNKFTYEQVENTITPKLCPLDVSDSTIKRMLTKLAISTYLLKVSTATYRLNPFTYLPYRSDGSKLQREWNEIVKTQQHAALYKVLEAIKVETDKPKRFSLNEVGKLSGNGMERLMDAGMRAAMSDEEKWEIYNKIKKE